MSDFTPTPEQIAAVDLAANNGSLAVEALAGTGKTSTLKLIADEKQQSGERGLYMAFNKAIVTDAASVFPDSVNCRTAHSLAFGPVGKKYAHRLNARRLRSQDLANLLGVDPMNVSTKFGTKRLAPGFLAGMVMRGVRRFCMTADEEIEPRHIPMPDTMKEDAELRAAWNEIREQLVEPLEEAWDDVLDVDGRVPFEHNFYLKLFGLSQPKLTGDFLLIDEAQDLNPVMLGIAEAQRERMQLIFVGDARQQIYEWNGAVNAMEQAPVDERTFLTHSFRFGEEIAGQANDVLAMLGCDQKITGRGAAGTLGPIQHPDVTLSRTNAAAVRRALDEMDRGRRPHIVGGADDVVSFAKGAKDLMGGRKSYHPELACFDDWHEVRDYTQSDELGGDLKLLVKLIDEFGAERIIEALARQPREDDADTILSTAHKSKGREWESVRLADDFPDGGDEEPPADEELRLLYVGCTRARSALDVESVGILHSNSDENEDEEAMQPW